jgi:hypothetical protein
MFHLMALASVLGRPIYSVYPNVPSTVRTVIHGIVQPRISDNDIDDNTIYIMWSRDGGIQFVICLEPGMSQTILFHCLRRTRKMIKQINTKLKFN